MRNFFKNLRLLPRSSLLFFSASVLLLALSMVQVNCPICSSIATNSSVSSLVNLKVLEVKGEFIDLKSEHEWCIYAYFTLKYKIDISVINEGSESLSAYLPVTGKRVRAGEEFVVESIKLLYVEVPGKEIKQIEEVIDIKLSGFKLQEVAGVPEMEFSVITDPEEIKANCPICRGEEKVAFFEWLKAVAQ